MNEEEELDEKVSFLSDLFPDMETSILVEAVLNSEGSKTNAIDYILAYQADTQIPIIDDDFKESYPSSVLELHNKFPEIAIDAIMEFISANPTLSQEQVEKELHFNITNKARPNTKQRRIPLEVTEVTRLYCEPVITSDGIEINSSQQPFVFSSSSGDIKNVILTYLGTKLGPKSGLTTDNIDVDLDYSYYREEASRLHEKRVGLLRRAAESHSKGDLTGGSAAQFYSSESLRIKGAVDMANRYAAYSTFSKMNCGDLKATVDLHGLTVSEALEIVDLICKEIKKQTLSKDCFPLKIIVGAGKHSAAGPRLRPAINERLWSNNLRFSHDGHAIFTLYNSFFNDTAASVKNKV